MNAYTEHHDFEVRIPPAHSRSITERIAALDGYLSEGCADVSLRPLKVIQALAPTCAHVDSGGCNIPADISGTDPLVQQVVRWYQRVYGRKAEFDFDFRKSVVVLRGAPYVVRFPPNATSSIAMPYGASGYNASGYNASGYSAGNDTAPSDDVALGWVSEATPELWELVGPRLRTDISASLRVKAHLLEGLSALTDLKLRMDYETAINAMLSGQQQYGFSRWCSQRAVARALAALCHVRLAPITEPMDLLMLARKAERIGMQPIDTQLLRQVQTESSARFGGNATLHEAVDGHEAALLVLSHVARMHSAVQQGNL